METEGLLNPVFLVKTCLRTGAPSPPECRGAQRCRTTPTPPCTRPAETLNIPDASAEDSPVRQKHNTQHESTASTKGTPALCEHPATRLWPRAGRGRGSGLQGNRGRREPTELGVSGGHRGASTDQERESQHSGEPGTSRKFGRGVEQPSASPRSSSGGHRLRLAPSRARGHQRCL